MKVLTKAQNSVWRILQKQTLKNQKEQWFVWTSTVLKLFLSRNLSRIWISQGKLLAFLKTCTNVQRVLFLRFHQLLWKKSNKNVKSKL